MLSGSESPNLDAGAAGGTGSDFVAHTGFIQQNHSARFRD